MRITFLKHILWKYLIDSHPTVWHLCFTEPRENNGFGWFWRFIVNVCTRWWVFRPRPTVDYLREIMLHRIVTEKLIFVDFCVWHLRKTDFLVDPHWISRMLVTIPLQKKSRGVPRFSCGVVPMCVSWCIIVYLMYSGLLWVAQNLRYNQPFVFPLPNGQPTPEAQFFLVVNYVPKNALFLV